MIKVGPNHKEIILHENLMAYENGEDDPQQYRSYQFTFDRVYDQVCLFLCLLINIIII